MAFLKKPFVAVILCLIAVLLATFISVNIKLGRDCDRVTDGFYTGVLSSGITEDSLYGQINAIIANSDELAVIAAKCGLDTVPLKTALDNMRSGLTYSHDNISYIYFLYDELCTQLRALDVGMASSKLEARDADAADELFRGIAQAQAIVKVSGYNESVRLFMRDYERFPTAILGKLTGVDAPDYFS